MSKGLRSSKKGPTRRALLGSAAVLAPALALSSRAFGQPVPRRPQPEVGPPPIVFVHGNGDTAALWTTTLWRFECQWLRPPASARSTSSTRLRAATTPSPSRCARPRRTRCEGAFAQGRRSAPYHRPRQVALIGNSRGGNVIRNYVKNGGGAANVSHAILGGTPNHGVSRLGADARQRIQRQGPVPHAAQCGPQRSGAGRALHDHPQRQQRQVRAARRGVRRRAGAGHGRGLRRPRAEGRENVVTPRSTTARLPDAPAFAEMYRFITGRPPAQLRSRPKPRRCSNGKVNGMEGGVPTNLPVAGAKVEVYEVSPRDRRAARRGRSCQDDGAPTGCGDRSTPTSKPTTSSCVTVPGHAITHIYRSPFPALEQHRPPAPGDDREGRRRAGSVVSISRPRGYFGHGRDVFTLDGKVPPGINHGVPGAATGKLLPSGGAAARRCRRASTTSDHRAELAGQGRPHRVRRVLN